MSKCPVCDTELNAPICPECSFDTSRHYEAFPTFAPVPAADAVSINFCTSEISLMEFIASRS